jgi:hypothetical protein
MMFEHGDLFTGQIGVGLLISVTNIAIHAVIMSILTWTGHRASIATEAVHVQVRLVLVMMATVTVLMFAHALEIGVWALTYVSVQIVPERGDAYYFAFVNYTTLGYGDVLPVRRWRLLGPMAAMNGVLLFGWSTAVIYDILRTIAGVIPMKPKAG